MVVGWDLDRATGTEQAAPAAGAHSDARGHGGNEGSGVGEVAARECALRGTLYRDILVGRADVVVGGIAVGRFVACSSLGYRGRLRSRRGSCARRDVAGTGLLFFRIWGIRLALCAALGGRFAVVLDGEESGVLRQGAVDVNTHCVFLFAYSRVSGGVLRSDGGLEERTGTGPASYAVPFDAFLDDCVRATPEIIPILEVVGLEPGMVA